MRYFQPALNEIIYSVFIFKAMQHSIAELGTQIEAARLLVYNAARRKEAGMDFVKEAAMAKFYAAEVGWKINSYLK